MPAADGACVFYVDAQHGVDTARGTSAASALASLTEARDRVRAARSSCPDGVAVELGAGRHFLGAPLELDGGLDSGHAKRARIEWRGPAGAAVASISAGVPVTDWAPVPGLSGLWEAPLPRGTAALPLRQMWVGGRRATRDVRPLDASRWQATDNGFSAPRGGSADTLFRRHSLMAAGDGVELIFTGRGESRWTQPRCGVTQVDYYRHVEVHLQQPC